ncbi:type II secretion system F family protein [Terriglobus sp. RCC_193]|uniref:type II secretion system F family protein n=1 Tax=Terriglobus sp. RCC_193 TaxID=3239218 RepID=UPI003524C1F8
MNVVMIVFVLSAGFALFCTLMLVALPLLAAESEDMGRLRQVVEARSAIAKFHAPRLQDTVAGWTSTLSRRFGLQRNKQATEKLEAAGLRTPIQMDSFLAVQWIAPLAGLFAGSFVRGNPLLACVAFAAAGYLLPDIWLRRRIRRHKDRIRRSLPDALDLLNICVEAGLGLDQAMLRVSDELALSHPELYLELQRVQLEQRIGGGRIEAWKRFAERSGTEEVQSFVGMLTQSERFGTPISRALTRFADDLRLQRKQRAEEAAAKTKVKIVFPLVFFIFPCLFLVLLAPAILSLYGVLKDIQ